MELRMDKQCWSIYTLSVRGRTRRSDHVRAPLWRTRAGTVLEDALRSW